MHLRVWLVHVELLRCYTKSRCLSGDLSMIPAVHAFHDGSREMPAAFSPGPDAYKWWDAVVTPQDRGLRQKSLKLGRLLLVRGLTTLNYPWFDGETDKLWLGCICMTR